MHTNRSNDTRETKQVFTKRKIGKHLVNVAMLGLLLSPVALSSAKAVNADEKIQTVSQTIDVDKQLEEAVAKAKGLGVEIKAGPKKTFQSKAELDAFKADLLKKTNEAISAAEKAKADIEVNKAANQKANEDYQKALADYKVKKAEYDKQLEKYNAEIEQLKSLTTKDGYLSEAIGQSLIFESEPNAQLKIDTVGRRVEGNKYVVTKGQTLTATYTNLQNSSYNGEKIGKVVYTYTAKDDADSLDIKSDPTVTVTTSNEAPANKNAVSNVHFKAQFYDLNGKLITFTEKNPAIFALNSLNRSKLYVGTGRGESVVNLSRNARFVPITGSEVKQVGNWIYSQKYNDYFENGTRFGANEGIDPENYWDGPDRPNRWYGAGTAILTTGDSIEFDIVNEAVNAAAESGGQFWFAFNSKVATAKVAEKPAEPKAPEKPQQKLTNNTTEKISVEISPASLVNTTHVEVGTNKELAPKEEGTKPKKNIDGYEFVETKTKDGNTIHYYTPKKPDPKPEVKKVFTKHIDITTGKELHQQEEGTKPKRSFDGYEFVETKTKDGNTIHYYKPVDKTPIKPKEDKAITKHFDITTGKEIAPQEDGNQPKKDIPNYEFVETKTKTGETDHYYKPISKPITRHIDKDTGKDIVPPEDGNKPKKDIPGYRFVETKDKDGNTYHYYQKVHTRHYDITTGKELVPQEDGTQPKKDIPNYEFVETKDKDGDTEHFYRPIKKVYTKHIDKKTGKELVPQEDGKQPKKDIPGYRFVETKDEDGNTIHYYEQVITKHLEVGTNKELAPQEDGQQPKKDIEGYEFVETKDDNGDTIHYYKPIAKVITKHIDIDTKEEIAPQEDGKQPKKDISGYEFVETKDDNGNTLHYYHKMKKPAAIKGKTPAKYADTNEAAGIVQSVIGALGLTSLAGFGFWKKRKK